MRHKFGSNCVFFKCNEVHPKTWGDHERDTFHFCYGLNTES